MGNQLGRPPKPTEVKAREGTLRSRDKRHPTLVAGRGAPPPPRGSSAAYRKVWKEVVDLLDGVLDRADAIMVESLVVRLTEAREAERHVAEHGLLLTVVRVGRDGTEWQQHVENPAAAVGRKARVEVRQLCDRLGIGPTARARLGNAGGEGRPVEDDLDGLGEIVNLRAV